MNAAPDFDFAPSIRYALTSHPTPDGGVDIVLDLFRGATPALTRKVASVSPRQAAPLVAACRRFLERRGAHAVVSGAGTALMAAPDPACTAPVAAWTAPVAAFDWMFAG